VKYVAAKKQLLQKGKGENFVSRTEHRNGRIDKPICFHGKGRATFGITQPTSLVGMGRPADSQFSSTEWESHSLGGGMEQPTTHLLFCPFSITELDG
jgi:hypothetical protein